MSILEFCQPRTDLRAGTLNPEIFTANLMQVIDHYRGDPDVVQNIYTDPVAFFAEGAYPTEGMRQVLRNCFGRLGGTDATYPAIQRMESAFGGGKTHTLIGATHLAFQGTAIAAAAQGRSIPPCCWPPVRSRWSGSRATASPSTRPMAPG